MKQTPAQKGTIFTKYGVLVLVVVVILFGVLYLAGDFVYSQIRPTTPTIKTPQSNTFVGTNPPLIQGEMPLGVAVKIFIDDKEAATRTSQAQTIWSYTPEQQLEVGKHTIYVYAVSEQGFRSKKSDVVTFEVPIRPQITSIADGQKSTTQPTIAGESAPNAEINLYVDDEYKVSTHSDEKGKWKFDDAPKFVLGTHKVYVSAVQTVGEFGNTSETMTITIQTRAQQ